MDCKVSTEEVSSIIDKIESLMEVLEKLGNIDDDPCYDPFRRSWWKLSDVRTAMLAVLEPDTIAGTMVMDDEGPM